MVLIFVMTFWCAFYGQNKYVFWFKYPWSLFLGFTWSITIGSDNSLAPINPEQVVIQVTDAYKHHQASFSVE